MTSKQKINFLALFLLLISSCAYYNTFFNAEESYRLARQKQLSEKSGGKISSEVRKNYEKAIKKSWKVLDLYGDSSAYADDALFLIGKSHFNLAEYGKAERVLEQFILKYVDSEYRPEARLWLARTYVKLDKDDKALEQLKILNKEDVSSKIAGEAQYILGELYFKREDYPQAIKHFEKAIDLSSDELLIGGALFQSGEAYLKLKKYEKAIEKFDRVSKRDIPVLREFEARMKSINSIIKLKDYQEAEKRLKKMHQQKRFEKQFSLIDTRLANIAELEGNEKFAADSYYDVLKTYPRTEGAAMASYYLANLYEHYFNMMDSAKAYYDNVRKQSVLADSLKAAEKRAKLLAEYLKMRNQIIKDRDDLRRLAVGDSALVDSVIVATEDTTAAEDNNEKAGTETGLKDAALKDQAVQSTLTDKGKSSAKDQKTTKKKPTKKAVPRDPAKVEASLKKNMFALAEYFLLKYQNYDSAAVAYKNFIKTFDDSLLVPKAYYSLYYIYKNIKKNEELANQYKTIILDKYPNTVYARKLSGKDVEKKVVADDSKEQFIKKQFLLAENYLDEGLYDDAIQLYQQIAANDSTGLWGQKARYAIAYIYEKDLHDTSNAVAAYTVVAQLYPDTPFGKIAKKKIEKPKIEEIAVPDSNRTGAGEGQDSLNTNISASDSTKKIVPIPEDKTAVTPQTKVSEDRKPLPPKEDVPVPSEKIEKPNNKTDDAVKKNEPNTEKVKKDKEPQRRIVPKDDK